MEINQFDASTSGLFTEAGQILALFEKAEVQLATVRFDSELKTYDYHVFWETMHAELSWVKKKKVLKDAGLSEQTFANYVAEKIYKEEELLLILEECESIPERQFLFALLEKRYEVAFSQNPVLMLDGNTYLIASYSNKLRQKGDFLEVLEFNQAILSSPFLKETFQGICGYLEIMNLKNPTTLPWKDVMYQNPEVKKALTKQEIAERRIKKTAEIFSYLSNSLGDTIFCACSGMLPHVSYTQKNGFTFKIGTYDKPEIDLNEEWGNLVDRVMDNRYVELMVMNNRMGEAAIKVARISAMAQSLIGKQNYWDTMETESEKSLEFMKGYVGSGLKVIGETGIGIATLKENLQELGQLGKDLYFNQEFLDDYKEKLLESDPKERISVSMVDAFWETETQQKILQGVKTFFVDKYDEIKEGDLRELGELSGRVVIEIALAFLGGGPIISKLKNLGKSGVFAKTAKATEELSDLTEYARYGEKVGEELTDAKEAADSLEFIETNSKSSRAFQQKIFKSSFEERLAQTPGENNKIVEFINKELRGESKCTLKPPPDAELQKIFDEFGIGGIEYKNAVPDFSPVSKLELDGIDMTNGRTGAKGTYTQANNRLATMLNESSELAAEFGITPKNGKSYTASDISRYMVDNKLTWHELNDLSTVQMVPTKVNSAFGHLGGISEATK